MSQIEIKKTITKPPTKNRIRLRSVSSQTDNSDNGRVRNNKFGLNRALTLGAVAAALLLIPRRSSRKDVLSSPTHQSNINDKP